MNLYQIYLADRPESNGVYLTAMTHDQLETRFKLWGYRSYNIIPLTPRSIANLTPAHVSAD